MAWHLITCSSCKGARYIQDPLMEPICEDCMKRAWWANERFDEDKKAEAERVRARMAVHPKPAPAGPRPQTAVKRPTKMVKAGKMTPAGRVMLSRQGGVCALCGVPGWGTHKGKTLKTGSLLRARCGQQVMGIYCRPCAAFIQKLRLRATRYCEAKRGPSGHGPGDQGGS